MNWDYLIDNCLLNVIDELTGLKAYHICKYAAVVDAETGKIFYEKEFEIMKEVYFDILSRYKNNLHLDLEENLEISVNKIKNILVHFENDSATLFLKNQTGGGVISLMTLSDISKYFILGFYSEFQKIQSFEGDVIPQNLDYLIKALNCTRKYMEKFKNNS